MFAPSRSPSTASPAARCRRARLAARALVVFAVYFLLSSYLPLLWADTLAPLQLFDLSGWPTWAAAAVGLLVYELLAYAYHRGMHSVDAWFGALSHQMHHSAERLDVYGAFWFSPLDMVGWTLVPSVALTRARPAAGGGDGDDPRDHLPRRSSSTPTCARRAGSATSCSARRATRSTTRAASTPRTTPTCR